MTDEELNRYCAEVMGERVYKEIDYICIKIPNDNFMHQLDEFIKYDPATNLNQMAEVFDKLVQRISGNNPESMAFYNQMSSVAIEGKGIAQAMREFIESTGEI